MVGNGELQRIVDGYICRTNFQVKNGAAMSHQGTSAHVQTFLPVEEALDIPWTILM